jgi:Zn-dependent protease with chaperone function
VLAHELGHYKHKHVWKRIALLRAGSLAFLWLLGRLIDAALVLRGLGMRQCQRHRRALVLFSLVLPVFSLPAGAADLRAVAQARIRSRRLRRRSRPPPATWSPRWSSSTATTPRR